MPRVMRPVVKKGHYTGALRALAGVRKESHLLDQVMVMTDDPRCRDNRLRLLAQLESLITVLRYLQLAT